MLSKSKIKLQTDDSISNAIFGEVQKKQYVGFTCPKCGLFYRFNSNRHAECTDCRIEVVVKGEVSA